MTRTNDAEPSIDRYLARVRAALRGLSEREVDDTVSELRSHLVDLTASEGVDAAIRSLGDPVDLANTYRSDSAMVQAECAGSSLTILQGLRHASSSRVGRVLVTVLYVFGYANVLTMWAAVIEKVITPSRVGFWFAPGGLLPLTLVTDGQAPVGGRELLGWWLVPILAVTGWLLREGIDLVARWWIRHYRRSSERGLAAVWSRESR
jgi:hypothetical protein